MNPAEHKKRHAELDASLNELVSDFVYHTQKNPAQSTIAELMGWSYQETLRPTEK